MTQNKKRITGIVRPRRIRMLEGMQKKWEKDAAEMRARILQGKPAIKEENDV